MFGLYESCGNTRSVGCVCGVDGEWVGRLEHGLDVLGGVMSV